MATPDVRELPTDTSQPVALFGGPADGEFLVMASPVEQVLVWAEKIDQIPRDKPVPVYETADGVKWGFVGWKSANDLEAKYGAGCFVDEMIVNACPECRHASQEFCKAEKQWKCRNCGEIVPRESKLKFKADDGCEGK